MRMAAEIQTRPAAAAARRAIAGLRTWPAATGPAARSAATTTTSRSSTGRLLLALGDVSGKGTGAALLMTVLRAAVRAHWTEPALAEAVGAHQPHRLPERAVEQVRHLLPGARSIPPRAGSTT